MPFNKSNPVQLAGAKQSALLGLLRLAGVQGKINSVHYLDSLKAYKVGVEHAGQVSFHTFATSQVEEVTRPRLGA